MSSQPVEIKQDVVELLEKKEAGGHALPPRDCVALAGAPPNLDLDDRI